MKKPSVRFFNFSEKNSCFGYVTQSLLHSILNWYFLYLISAVLLVRLEYLIFPFINKFHIRSFTHSWNIRGYPKMLGVTWHGHARFLETNNQWLLLRHTKFYIRSFIRSWDIRGYPKNLGVTWRGHAPFWGNIIKGICLTCHWEYAYQILHS